MTTHLGDLETLLGTPDEVKTSQGTFPIKVFKIKKLPKLLKLLQPIGGKLFEAIGGQDVKTNPSILINAFVGTIGDNEDAFFEFLSFVTEQERAVVEELDPGETFLVLQAIWEKNKSFFLQQVTKTASQSSASVKING